MIDWYNILVRNVRLLSLFNFFNNFKLYGVVAILYFAEVSGSYTAGMSVYAVVTLSSAIFEIPTGIFSDLVGRKKTLLIGAVGSTLAILVYGLSTNIFALLLGSVIKGFANSLFSGNNDSLLHDSLEELNQQDRYAEWLGKVTSLFQVGSGIAAVIGSLLAAWSLKWVVLLSVFPVSLTIPIALLVREPSVISTTTGNIFAHLKKSLKLFSANKKIRLLTIIKTWYFALDEAAYEFNAAFVAMVWPVWAIGFKNVFGKTLGAISFASSGKILKKLGEEKVIQLRSIWDAVTRTLALLLPGWWSPFLLSSNSVWWATGQVAENSLLQKEFTAEQRSTLGSLVSLSQSIAFAVVALLLGILADTWGVIAALLILQVAKLPVLSLVRRVYPPQSS